MRVVPPFNSAHYIQPIPGMENLADVLFTLIAQFEAAGWTVAASGDGLAAFDPNGSVFLSAGAGANGFNNDLAWIIFRDGDGVAEVCWQITTAASDGLRLKYSPSAGFTGGTPGAGEVPSAADEVIIKGGGSDGAPTGGGAMNDTPSASDLLFGAIESRWPWRYWLLCIDDSSAPGNTFFFFPRDYAFGLPEDLDPYWWGRSRQSTTPDVEPAYQAIQIDSITQNAFSVEATITLAGDINRMEIPRGISGTDVPPSPLSSADTIIAPALIGRADPQGAPSGFKGYLSSQLRLLVEPPAGAIRTNLLTVDSLRDYIQVQDFALPWNGKQLNNISFVPGTFTADWFIPDGGALVDRYLMRAFDDTLAELVYWGSTQIDLAGSDYLGPGPLSDVIVDRILHRPPFQ